MCVIVSGEKCGAKIFLHMLSLIRNNGENFKGSVLLKESVRRVYRCDGRGSTKQVCTKQNQGEKSQFEWGNSGK